MIETNDSLPESHKSANVNQKQTPRKPRGIRSLSRITTSQPYVTIKPKKIEDTKTSVSELSLSELSISDSNVTKNPFAILKYFSENKTTEPIKQIFMNGYILPGCREAIEKIMEGIDPKKMQDIYVLNIAYDRTPYAHDKTGDIQPFLTESVENENSYSAAINGIREELRMLPMAENSVTSLCEVPFYKKSQSTRKISWYPNLLFKEEKIRAPFPLEKVPR